MNHSLKQFALLWIMIFYDLQLSGGSGHEITKQIAACSFGGYVLLTAFKLNSVVFLLLPILWSALLPEEKLSAIMEKVN